MTEIFFKIKISDKRKNQDTIDLVKKMYSWRGYDVEWAEQQPDQITLIIHDKFAELMGTLAIGFDSSRGLRSDDLYHDEINKLRDAGTMICEFTKLAVDFDGPFNSKLVLGMVFHVAYIYAYQMRGYTDLLIEVNPRHVNFYEKMLGFKQLGPERLNPRVNAPAVLLCVNMPSFLKTIQRLGGRPELAPTEKTLFPFFFSESDAKLIMRRLEIQTTRSS
jgi:hypothetical protein